MNAVSFVIRLAASVALVLTLTPIARSAGDDLERDKQALDVIAEFADRMCGTVPLDSHTKALTAQGKAELNGMVQKVVGLGIGGAAQYQTVQSQGLLQTQLAEALAVNTDCRKAVWSGLKDSLGLKGTETKPEVWWQHLTMPKATGTEVAQRLTKIGPKPEDLVVLYDGSLNTFHIWYRGIGSGTRYRYAFGGTEDLQDGPVSPFGFINNGKLVPAGIGGIGQSAVPIYFLVE